MWVERAARNNAAWCDAVCDSHGLTGTFHERLWACDVRTPPLYPDAVTLDAATSADEVLATIDTATSGCSVKDSFATLDLAPSGFRVLFEATWIACPTPGVAGRLPDRWSPVTDGGGLDRWRHASECDLGHALLTRDDIVIVAGRRAEADDEIVVAGGALNRSDSVVGISNVFSNDGHLDGAWSACLAFAGARFPAVPVVGYERGAALECALRHGFEAVGQLRVWIDDTVR